MENNQQQVSNPQTTEFKPYLTRYRFFNVFFYILADFSNSVMYATFAPIAESLTKIYDLTPFQVNMTTGVFLVLTPIIAFASNGFIDKFGAGKAVKLGCLITMIGAWLRVLINQSFAWAIVGQFIAGIAGPFIANSKGKVGANWFLPDAIAQVTMVISIFTTTNGTIGMLIPGLWFGVYDHQTDKPLYNEGKDLAFGLLLFQAFMISGTGLASILGFRSEPEKPPSFVSTVVREDYIKALKLLIKDCNYVLIFFAFSINFGLFTGVSSVLSFLIKPYGMVAQDASLVGISLIITGVIGCIIGSIVIKNNKNYKKFLIIANFFAFLSLILTLILIQFESIGLMIIGTGCLGFFLAPQVAVYYELACEVVFPIGEGSAVGFLFAGSSIFGLIFIIILSFIIQGDTKNQSVEGIIFAASMMILVCLIVFFVKQILKRLDVEKQQKINQEQGIQLQNLPLQNSDNQQNYKQVGNSEEQNSNSPMKDQSRMLTDKQELMNENTKKMDTSTIQVNSKDKNPDNDINQYNIDMKNDNKEYRLKY